MVMTAHTGVRIKKLREDLGMTVDELADASGKNRATIYRYENGDISNLPINALGSIAIALHTTIEYLIAKELDTEIDNIDSPVNVFAFRLKQLRERNRLSQTDLAKKLGTTKQNIYKYENGIVINIPSNKAEEIASALDTTPQYLMGWEDDVVSRSAPELANVVNRLDPEKSELLLTVANKLLNVDEKEYVRIKNILKAVFEI